MSRTYGIVPSLALRCGLPLSNGGEVFFGAGYIGDTGDPYYDAEGFVGGPPAVLRTMPLEIGLRGRPLRHANSGFAVGAAVQYIHVSERVPAPTFAVGSERPELTTWGWGARLLAMQEWQIPDTRWALGVEVSTGLGIAPVDRNMYEWEVNLGGVDLRGSLSFMP
jgi:hypothetical protein